MSLPVLAQDAVEDREALIDRGIVLRQQAKDDEALALFRRAAELRRDGRVLAQIAFAEQAMGRWGESHQHLVEALDDHTDPWIQEHREQLANELIKIDANVGRLDVRTNVAVAKLTIDGKEVGTSPLAEPLIVTAGAVVVSAQAAGYLSTTRRVPVHAGALSRVELILVPEPTQRIEVRLTRTEERIERRPVWLYVAGAGALVAISAIGPWVKAGKLTDGLKEECSAAESCGDRYQDDRDKVQRLDAATNVLLFTGLSTAVLAGAAYWLWPRREQRTIQPTAALSPQFMHLGARISY
jgi:tetratricopeptide (TPR) repeat protein